MVLKACLSGSLYGHSELKILAAKIFLVRETLSDGSRERHGTEFYLSCKTVTLAQDTPKSIKLQYEIGQMRLVGGHSQSGPTALEICLGSQRPPLQLPCLFRFRDHSPLAAILSRSPIARI